MRASNAASTASSRTDGLIPVGWRARPAISAVFIRSLSAYLVYSVDRLSSPVPPVVLNIRHFVAVRVRGLRSVAVRDDKGKLGSTQVELSYRRMTILPSIAKRKRYPALTLTVLHAREPEEPVGRPRIDWKLITDLPVDGYADAVEKLHWYAMRWKIEVFHKILKSGCRAEQARLRTAERLVRLLAVFCILSWRVFWLTMLNRIKPDLEASLVLTELETSILDRLIPDPIGHPLPAGTLSRYLIKIARLGGYLDRAKDPPPGNIVMWRGLGRLSDIALGATLQINDMGN